MKVPMTIVGGGASLARRVRIEGGEPKDLLGFGVLHQSGYSGHQQEGGYIPAWVGALAAGAPESARPTAILVELPPFSSELLAAEALEAPLAAGDQVNHDTLARLRPSFVNGPASGNGWLLRGIDLRYRYEVKDGALVKERSDDNRQSIHKNLHEGLNHTKQWDLSAEMLKLFYRYLVGTKDDRLGYDHVVNQFRGRAKAPANVSAIFEQAATVCRELYAGVPEAVSEFVIARLAEFGMTDVEDFGIMPPYEDQVFKLGIGDQLPNLAILGHVLSPAVTQKNVLVIAGGEHVEITMKVLLAANQEGLVSLEKGDCLVTELRLKGGKPVVWELPAIMELT